MEKFIMKYTRIILFALLLYFSLSFSVYGQTDLTKYLPEGYNTTGDVDYTTYLQKGLDENKSVLMPDFPVLINKVGLNLKNNQIVSFQSNSCLIMEPNTESSYGILNIIDVDNVKVNNAYLIGDKDKHLGTNGEWGMGINILSSSNVIINNPTIEKAWGDGIYIGEISHKERKKYNKKKYYSSNVQIIGGKLDGNRRNGISVISVKNLLIENTLIQNTNGKLPMAGIDIEPNNNEQFLEDITIRNVTTKNNEEVGVKYVPLNFVGHRKKTVRINIENHSDYGSKIGLFIGGLLYDKLKKVDNTILDGQIVIKNFKSYSNSKSVQIGSIQKFNPKIIFDNFSVFDKNIRNTEKENKIKTEVKTKKLIYK